MRRLTDTETQNSVLLITLHFGFIYLTLKIFKQFLFGDNEMDPKLLESVVVDGHGYYEKKDGEAEHDGMSMDYYCKLQI